MTTGGGDAATGASSASRRREQQEIRRSRRTNRMLIAMVAIFIVCWLPLNVINLLFEYREQEISKSKATRKLEKEIMQGTMSHARRRRRPRTAWMDNIKTWTGLPVEESVRMTEDRDKWRKYVHGVANPRIQDG